ncbi:MAG: PorT family protein [Flavobacteriales bacterium]|nr:PorT family protein [Flavobacteriales bacterium]
MRKKITISSLFTLLLLNSFSQIVTKEQINSENKSIHKKKAEKDTSSRFYAEASFASSFRSLESNVDFLNKPLGERANESKLGIWSYSLGMTTPMSNHIYFDGALSLLRNGEQYSWESTISDSTFNYQSKYNYIALPLQIKLQGGKNLKYFIGGGLIPQMNFSYRQNQQWTDSLGAKGDEKIKVNNEINSFAFSWLVSAGLELQFENNFGLRLSANYRNQISNTYIEFSDYIHKASAIGINIGITRKF